MKYYHYILGLLVLLTISCSKADDTSEPEVLNPTSPSLVYPANNEPCLDAVSLNDTQSQIAFQWNASENVNNYTLVITNLNTNETQELPVTSSPYTATLAKAEPFSWKVVANGAVGSTPAESDRWKFYLAGNSETNYAPFPAELISPQAASTVSANNDSEITLIWLATDVDSDLATYTLFMDSTDASTEITQIGYEQGNMEYNVEVINGETYYWRVVSLDQTGNTSDSGTYGFRVN